MVCVSLLRSGLDLSPGKIFIILVCTWWPWVRGDAFPSLSFWLLSEKIFSCYTGHNYWSLENISFLRNILICVTVFLRRCGGAASSSILIMSELDMQAVVSGGAAQKSSKHSQHPPKSYNEPLNKNGGVTLTNTCIIISAMLLDQFYCCRAFTVLSFQINTGRKNCLLVLGVFEQHCWAQCTKLHKRCYQTR